jgi:1-deoxy-D-xylulose-5-phosphate synthase
MVAKDEDELADMLFTALQYPGPIAVRYPRGVGPGTPVKDVPNAIPIGKAELLQHGDCDNDRVAIFALGALIPMAKEIARKLEGHGYSAAVINARFTKPIDAEMLEFYARSVDVILTLEDHVLRVDSEARCLRNLIPQSSALVGPIGSSSTANLRLYEPSTGSAWKSRLKNFSPA